MDSSKAREILGLTGNPSPADIKRAYRQQVKLWHPDRYSEGSSLKRLAEKNIQDANLAYAFLRDRKTAAPRPLRPSGSETRGPTRWPAAPSPGKALHGRFDHLLRFVAAIAPRKALDRLLRWLQSGPRNRFRPWYRYPASSETQGNVRHAVNFDHFLQDAMQNRTALKHIHRARRRSSGSSDDDKIPPVASAAKPRKTGRNPSSDKG